MKFGISAIGFICGILMTTFLIGCNKRAPFFQSDWRLPYLAICGELFFFDSSLSADGKTACASCHKPERAFTDGLTHASGAFGRRGIRNTPSLLDVARQRSLFWDGRREHLEDQALDPVFNEVEQGLHDRAQLVAKLGTNPRYEAMAQAAYGVAVAQLTADDVAGALAAFERTLVSGDSPFDRFQRGQRDALSEAARRGWVVFDRRVRCTRCHVVVEPDGQPALFTDHQFHSLAIGFAKVERDLPRLTSQLIALRRSGQPIDRAIMKDAEVSELGRFAVTLAPRDVAAFKTPGLRNVALTAPYMHDGSVTTLEEAIDREVYARSERGAPPILTPFERSDLLAFLRSLTSDVLSNRAAL
jgi:cytochrome c peroxidase